MSVKFLRAIVSRGKRGNTLLTLRFHDGLPPVDLHADGTSMNGVDFSTSLPLRADARLIAGRLLDMADRIERFEIQGCPVPLVLAPPEKLVAKPGKAKVLKAKKPLRSAE